jgi:WD40 repeat protein
MKKNLLSSNIALILAGTSLALVGCSSDSSNSNNPPVIVSAPAASENANILCIDSNNNGQCDNGETQQINATTGTIPQALRSNEFHTLLQLEDGALLVAPIGAIEISAYSTLVNNELLFNPGIAGNAVKAAEYLTAKNIATELSAAQNAEFNISMAAALKLSDTAHPFQTIAAISDQIIATGKFAVSVTADDIIKQATAKRALNFSEESFGWEAGDSDESPIATTVLEGRNLAVIATKYHNNIIVIDTQTKTVLKKTGFAQIDGDRYDVDVNTGASEKPFTDMQASPDAQSVYISVEGKGDTSNAEAGLYRIAINDDGTVAAIDAESTKFYANENIGNFFTLNDGSILIEDEDADSIIVLNSAFEKIDEIESIADIYLDAISSLYPSADGKTTYAVIEGTDDSSTTLNRFDKASNTKTHSLDIEHELDGLIFFAAGEKALAYNEDGYVLIINLADLTISKMLDLDGIEIETAAVSENGQFALLAGHDNKKLMIFDLTSFESAPVKAVAVENRIRALTISNDGLVLAAGGHPGSFAYLDTPVLGNVLTPVELVAADKSALTEIYINNGQDLSLVVSDLAMPTNIPAGAGAHIVWTSDTDAIVTTAIEGTVDTPEQKIGAVTRSADTDISANISATISYQFRNEAPATEQSAFDLLIRKAPAALIGSESLSSNSNYVYHIDTSPAGTTALSVFSKSNNFNLLTRTDAGTLSYLLGGNDDEGNRTHQDYPTEFEKTRPVGTHYLDENHALIAFPSGEDSEGNATSGALVTYDLTAANLISTDGNTTTPVLTTMPLEGSIKAISHINNNRLALIEEVKAEGVESLRNAVIYSVNGFTLENPVRFTIASNASAIEVDASGNSVFVISGKTLHKYTLGTTEPAAVTTSELSPYVLAISGDTIYSASDDGKLQGFNQTDLVENFSFNSGYGQKSRTLEVVADEAHMSINSVGLVIVDLTKQGDETGAEHAIFAHERQRRAAISDDGEWAFTAQYISKSDNTFQLIKLK